MRTPLMRMPARRQLRRQRHHLVRRRLGVPGVDQQHHVVGLRVGEMLEGQRLVVVRLDEGMRHGAEQRNAELLRRPAPSRCR